MSNEKLTDDVKGTIAFLLGEMRTGLLINAANLSPTTLVDDAISNTLGIIETHFELTSQMVSGAEGLPLTVNGLVDEYWAMVRDDGDYDQPIDLRKAYAENQVS